MQRAPDPRDAPTPGAIIGEVLDLTAGLSIMLLPLLTIDLPGVILLLIVPAALLIAAAAIPVVIAAALLGPPYLVIRSVRRRRRVGPR
jgi:Flp pilus assembly protein TadB